MQTENNLNQISITDNYRICVNHTEQIVMFGLYHESQQPSAECGQTCMLLCTDFFLFFKSMNKNIHPRSTKVTESCFNPPDADELVTLSGKFGRDPRA